MRYLKYILIFVMLALLFFKRSDPASIGMGIGVITGIFVILFFKSKYPEKYRSDERLERLSDKSESWSWKITLFLSIFLYWLDYLEFIELSAKLMISIIFWVMVASIIGARLYLFRRPDIR